MAEVGPRTSLNGLSSKVPAEIKGHCLRGSTLKPSSGMGTAPGVLPVPYEKTVFVFPSGPCNQHSQDVPATDREDTRANFRDWVLGFGEVWARKRVQTIFKTNLEVVGCKGPRLGMHSAPSENAVLWHFVRCKPFEA